MPASRSRARPCRPTASSTATSAPSTCRSRGCAARSSATRNTPAICRPCEAPAMSSSRIEQAPAELGSRRPSLFKRILPRSLFGRSVLILVTPLILVQAVATWVFYDRLWDTVVRRLASAAAGDIALTINARSLISGSRDEAQLFDLAHGSTEFSYLIVPGAQLPDSPPAPTGSLIERHLTNALAERVGRPF